MQKDSGDSSGSVKYFILHDISTIYFKSFSSFMKNKRILQDQEQICSILDTESPLSFCIMNQPGLPIFRNIN